MSPSLRKLFLSIHLMTSVGWVGAVIVYLALGVTAVTNPDDQTVRSAWTAMDVTGWWAIVPLAFAALLTGVVMSLGTPWGLFRHYWTVISLILTVVCTTVLVLHMPTVTLMAQTAQHLDGPELRALGGDLFHPGVGLVVLLAIMILNVYKPAGLTPYGWRKQREQREARRYAVLHSATEPVAPVVGSTVQRPAAFRTFTDRAAYFVFHFAEMVLAMFVGMAAFLLLRSLATGQGYAPLLDTSSVEFQVGMASFMLVPMLAWMRLRGCRWRECGEMCAAMLVPTAMLIGLRDLQFREVETWFSTNQHALMLLGMLVVMLYRREHYSNGYSLARWPTSPRRRHVVGA
jgi:hypothetical protein